MPNIEERAEALLQEAESTSSTERITEILDQHWACFDMDMCEICEYLEEEHYLDLLFELASNENITVEQQSRVVDAAFKWQGKIMGVMISLASNPAISDEYKEFTLDTSFWYGTGEAPKKRLQSLFKSV
jgi:hypothetical protein